MVLLLENVKNYFNLEVFTDGNVILYFNEKTSNTAHTGVTSSGMGMIYKNFDYYLGVSGEDVVTDLRNGNTYSKRFKKIAKKYFSDCPALIKKLE